MSTPSVLMVAGEASGDRIGAKVARALAPSGVSLFGMGGAASASAGVELVADLRRTTAMGGWEVARRLPAIASAYVRLWAAVRTRRPRAAVLVDYTEFNLRLGRALRARGVYVLWCVAPQVWAWRPGRIPAVARALDRMAVILPFEEALWRRGGVDAHYVGHPALDAPPADPQASRTRLGIAAGETAVALLPGSRPHEVRALLAPILEGFCEARRRRPLAGRLLASASLDRSTAALVERAAASAGVGVAFVDANAGAGPLLAAFDASIAASGTATLESALAGAPPVVVYRLGRLSGALVRRRLTTPFVALPNVLLGEARYPELLQERLTPATVAEALLRVLDEREPLRAASATLRAKLGPAAHDAGFGARTAGLLVSALAERRP